MKEQITNPTRRRFIRALGIASTGIIYHQYGCETPENSKESKSPPFHKILTCNIRVALAEDDEKGVGWNARKNLCSKIIHSYAPDIICLQEVIKVQMDDMRSFFPGYASFGFEGPEMDPFPEGYHWIAKNPIFFSEKRYEILTGGNFWLSDNPLIGGSKAWETARARNVSWVRLKEIKTQKEFRVINTHLDHISQDAREKQISLIMTESNQYSEEFPQIFTGDFNVDIKNPVIDIIKESGWSDTYALVHGSSYPNFTYHGFDGEEYKSTKGPIDYIFIRGNIKAKRAEIIKDNDEGFYPSDHFFVSAEVEI